MKTSVGSADDKRFAGAVAAGSGTVCGGRCQLALRLGDLALNSMTGSRGGNGIMAAY
jgi:hypothetical protein